MGLAGGFFLMGDTLTPLLGSIDILEEAEVILEGISRDVQEYAQLNAPWQDQTGAARRGLTSDVYRAGDAVILQLYHVVDYGVWLETIQSGQYAIIMPTLEHFSTEVMLRCHATEDGFGGEFG